MSKFLYPFLLLAVPMFYPFLSKAQNKLESTGNVGIGTTTPTVKLSIYGTADDSAAISLQSASNSRFYIQQGGALLKIGGTTPGIGAINVLNTGNVGIGTSNPFAPLHVVTASGAAGIIAQSTASYSASGGAFLRLYNSGTPSGVNQRIGGLLIGSNPTSTIMRTGAQIDAYSEEAWQDGTSHPTYLRFLTTQKDAATPSERMRITADGNIQVQQNTQFGTGLSDRFSYNGKFQPNYGMQWTMDSWYASAPTLWVSSYGGMKFFTQAQPRITITVSGNVGIGTDDTKGYKFAVNGDAMFTRIKVKQYGS